MNSKFKFVNLLFATLILTLSFTFYSCVKDDFDTPPTETVDPNITADQIISLEEVLAKWETGKYVKIDLDKYVKGIVVSDDDGGNFYKGLVVEDESSDYGISLLVDEVELHNVYPVGRRVFIHLKDLWISDYNGLPQIGYGPENSDGQVEMSRIPSSLMRKIIIPGKAGNEVIPFEADINELGELRLNTLIKLTNVEFANLGDTYATVGGTSTSNRTIVNCNGDEIILRTSDFADFAGQQVAQGKGSIVGVYSIYRSDKQFTVRSFADIDMNGQRCGAPAGDETRMSIKDLRNVFKGTKTTAPKAYIQGVVISDLSNKNINGLNLVIQEGDAGIVVRFKNDHNFTLGQEIKVFTTDVELSEFNGLLQLNNVNLAFATLVGNGTLPTPKELTIQSLRSDFETYESTLVKIKKATLTNASGTYNGNATVTDATGNMILRTTSTATFANSTLKSGEVDVVAIVSEFTSSSFTPQLGLRNLDDVIGGTTTGGGDDVKQSIQDIKAKYTGTATTAPQGYIQGIVISDYSNKNITTKNLVIQSEGYGITVRFTADHAYALGAELKIKVSGVEISEFNKLLQLNNVPNANVTVIGTGNSVTPKEITIADLKADFERYESTLVTIKNGTISGGASYGATGVKVTDATGEMDLFTRTGTSGATFANTALATGSKNVTAIVSQFKSATTTTDGYQLNLRNLNDIQ